MTKGSALVGIVLMHREENVERFKPFHTSDLARRFACSGTAADRNEHVPSGRLH